MRISELTEKGFKCPSCGSQELRAGYHDWQTTDSFICETCGLRWQEDLSEIERLPNLMKNSEPEEWETRFIWVLHVANRFDMPLKNSDSSDSEGSLRDFKINGLRRIQTNVKEFD